MSQYKYAEIGDDVYFWFAANDTDGDAGDGASPLFDVRLAGAAADAIPTVSGTPTLLSHANYGAGLHELKVDTDGWAAGEYAVFCTLTISTVNPGGFVGSFLLRTAGTGALDVNIVSSADIDFTAKQKTYGAAWVTATGFATASVVGALTDVAAAGEVTEADTLMQYIKQLLNVLIGAAGIGAFPAESTPANGVSLAEVIRAIHADVTGLNGSDMKGTNGAALASVYTAARAAYLDELAAANLPADLDTVKGVTAKLDSMIEVIP